MNKSAREYAIAYVNNNDSSTRKNLIAEVVARAKVSKRARWGNLAKAMKAGDNARVAAYAAVGKAKREAWNKIRKAEANAKPKAEPKRKPPAKANTKSPLTNPNALVAEVAGLDDKAFVAFFDALVTERAK